MDVEDWGLLLWTEAMAIDDMLSSSSAGHCEEHFLSWVQGDAEALSFEDGSMNSYTVFQQLLAVCLPAYSSSWFSLLTFRNFSLLRAPIRMPRMQDGCGSSGEDAGRGGRRSSGEDAGRGGHRTDAGDLVRMQDAKDTGWTQDGPGPAPPRPRTTVWHPAKTTTRKSRCFCALHHHDRMLMSSCHIAFEHRHHLAFACIKLFSEKPSFVF